jgi:spore maturation protein CgeB
MIKILFYPAVSAQYTSNYDLAICYYEALKNNPNIEIVFFKHDLESFTPHDFDIIICFGSLMHVNFDYSFLRNLQYDCNATLVWWLHDDPYELESNFKFLNNTDIVITSDETSSLYYRPDVQSFFLPMAACEKCYLKSLPTSLISRFNFIGNAHPERIEFIKKLYLADQSLNLLDVFGTNWPSYLSKYNSKTSSEFSSRIYNRYLASLDVQRSYFLTKNEFGLEASSPGPRPFQIALSGGSVIHVSKVDLLENYLPKDSYYHVTCELELLELFKGFTTRGERDEQLKRRENAQIFTLTNHTIKSRASKFVDFLQEI